MLWVVCANLLSLHSLSGSELRQTGRVHYMSEGSEKLPIPAKTLKQLVFKFAESFAKALGFGVGDPLEPLVARLGGSISYKGNTQLFNGIPESIKVLSSNSFTIYLPVNTCQERDRFTIAHELGHLFLHYPLVQRAYGAHVIMTATRWVDSANVDLQRTEWEANWFAAAFLMPEFEFRQSCVTNAASSHLIAARFGVTEKAVEVRAKALGLVLL